MYRRVKSVTNFSTRLAVEGYEASHGVITVTPKEMLTITHIVANTYENAISGVIFDGKVLDIGNSGSSWWHLESRGCYQPMFELMAPREEGVYMLTAVTFPEPEKMIEYFDDEGNLVDFDFYYRAGGISNVLLCVKPEPFLF